MKDLFEAFNEGGVFMYIILLISLCALALIFYKIHLLYFKYRLSESELTRAIIKQVEANNYARAIQYCSSKANPLLNILKSVLLRANKSEKEIRRAIEIAASEEIPRVKKITHVLPHLSNISTMLGLLGTIRGLIIAFSGMEGGDAVKRQEALSTGIAIAFRATFFALSVAVTLIFAYVILNSKQNNMVAKFEHATSLLVDTIIGKNKKKAIAQ